MLCCRQVLKQCISNLSTRYGTPLSDKARQFLPIKPSLKINRNFSSSTSPALDIPTPPNVNNPIKPKKSILKSIAKFGFYSGLTVTSAIGVASSYAAYRNNFNLPDALVRTLRTGWAGLVTTVEYKWFYMTHSETDPGYLEAENAQHLKAARRVLQVCLKQGGLYIKLGQYAAANNHIYPKEWTDTLRVLQDQAATRDFEVVEELFKQEFGKKPSDMYQEFNPVPIAAASIAQVHQAVTMDGEKVAVKIQYPEIRDRFVIDMFSHAMVLEALAFFFPKLDVTWAGPELEEVLAQELDFLNEAKNSERAARGFNNNPDYYIPEVKWFQKHKKTTTDENGQHEVVELEKLTTDRILVTEWIDGVKITNIKGLDELGLSTKEVMTKLTTCLAEQLFLTGFLHADPHPGNIFVRKHPYKKGQSQIVLLDHGLYKALPETVRTFYCRLYRGFVTGHYEEIRDACAEIGITDWKLLAFIIFMRPLDMEFFTDTGISLSEARDLMKDKRALQRHMQKAAQDHIDEVMDLIKLIPREFLLILRNNNIVRSINREMGSPVNRFTLFGRQAIKGLKDSSHASWFKRYTDYFYYEFMIKKLEFTMWAESLAFKLLYTIGYIDVEITIDGLDEEIFEEMPYEIAPI